MSEGVGIWRCKACGTPVFPQRLLCPHCHGREFDDERVTEGVVEEVAVIRHMIGQENWQPRRIANVRTRGGPSMSAPSFFPRELNGADVTVKDSKLLLHLRFGSYPWPLA